MRADGSIQAEGLGLSVVALTEVYEGVYYVRDPEGQCCQSTNSYPTARQEDHMHA